MTSPLSSGFCARPGVLPLVFCAHSGFLATSTPLSTSVLHTPRDPSPTSAPATPGAYLHTLFLRRLRVDPSLTPLVFPPACCLYPIWRLHYCTKAFRLAAEQLHVTPLLLESAQTPFGFVRSMLSRLLLLQSAPLLPGSAPYSYAISILCVHTAPRPTTIRTPAQR